MIVKANLIKSWCSQNFSVIWWFLSSSTAVESSKYFKHHWKLESTHRSQLNLLIHIVKRSQDLNNFRKTFILGCFKGINDDTTNPMTFQLICIFQLFILTEMMARNKQTRTYFLQLLQKRHNKFFLDIKIHFN